MCEPSLIWDKRFLNRAKEISNWSKDPSTKVGCVIVNQKNNTVISEGFNGFPKGIFDHPELLSNREEKYKRILHAEQNALIFSNTNNLKYHTLYTYPLEPCNKCVLEIIQYGISRVVVPKNIVKEQRWKDSTELGRSLLQQAGIDVDEIEI